ncbi:MAG: transposase, partial [Deltaproteobacteria bacterium]|nr:transposase [Deltaproteobacteria bacterium]
TTVRYASEVAGIHYTTVYDWRRQFAAMGKEAFLKYQVSRPGRGIKQISPGKEHAVLKEWKNNPGFGPGQIRNQLRRQRVTISTISVRKIMQANGYQIRTKTKSGDNKRFEASRPLELAQMDILEFYINKLKVYIILLLDDYSRFILGWNLLEKTSMDEVIKVVQSSVSRYGKMEEVLTDRGFVFYSWHGINRFEKYLEMERIDHTHASAHHPRTLGKVEACNKNIKYELLKQHYFLTVQEARSAVEKWVNNYNYQRTHQGIGGLLVPAERFHGQADQVLSNLGQGVDIAKEKLDIERSIFNLVLNSNGDLTFYLMGKPIHLTGGHDGRVNA